MLRPGRACGWFPAEVRAASGTSGMSAAMNGAINLSTQDGWFPEFAKDKINAFTIPCSDNTQPDHLQDAADAAGLYDIIEKDLLPCYYEQPEQWIKMIKNSMQDIAPVFDSNRMAQEYYTWLYTNAG